MLLQVRPKLLLSTSSPTHSLIFLPFGYETWSTESVITPFICSHIDWLRENIFLHKPVRERRTVRDSSVRRSMIRTQQILWGWSDKDEINGWFLWHLWETGEVPIGFEFACGHWSTGNFEGLGLDGRIIPKWILNRFIGHGLDSSGSG